MKSKTLPATRVTPEFRDEIMQALHEGETLSSFMEESLRLGIRRRKAQEAFIAKGLASAEDARATQTYHAAEDVISMMEQKLQAAKARKPA